MLPLLLRYGTTSYIYVYFFEWINKSTTEDVNGNDEDEVESNVDLSKTKTTNTCFSFYHLFQLLDTNIWFRGFAI